MANTDDALSRLGRGAVELPAYAGPSDDPEPRPGGWVASVALILRPAGSVPEILLIRRAELDTDPWSGHMAFPGGRREAEDRSLLDTAIRETREETAIDLRDGGEPLGRLQLVEPVTRRLPPLTILPFVFTVPGDTRAAVASPEVAETHWLPLHHFDDPAARTEHRLLVDEEDLVFPAFSHGERIIWGLTERILTDLLDRIR